MSDALMNQFNFDTAPDRNDMGSVKYNLRTEAEKAAGLIPFSIADMEFETAPCVRRAIDRLAATGSFGYADMDDAYLSAITGWMQRRHQWTVQKEWILPVSGVVPALSVAIRAFSAPGDSILLMAPRYLPFESMIVLNDRVLVYSELKQTAGSPGQASCTEPYTVDFEDLEKKASGSSTKLFILCSPHNPVGKVWTVDELRKIAHICDKHGLLVISDEIHHDLDLFFEHHVFCVACPEMQSKCVILTAASKTFNLAGLQLANTIIPDPALRARYQKRRDGDGYSNPSIFGYHATIAAYNEGDAWVDAMLDRVRQNFRLLNAWFNENMPDIRMVPARASYLAWLDCRALGMDDDALLHLFQGKAGIIPNPGPWFGLGGSGFMRLNIAMPWAEIEKALCRLAKARA